MNNRPALTAVSFVLLAAGAVPAQWSATATAHLAIGDGPGDQVQPKIAPRADGGCYVSWFDSDPNGSPPFGFDVRIQRLDAGGNALWPHRGVLVADRGFSSTQDYDLDVDLAGNAVLAFRDDRLTGTQITAASIDPAGNLRWGSTGVQLTSTTAFVAIPKVCGTSDGSVVVAWTQNSDVRVQKLDPAGVMQWQPEVVLSAAGRNLAPSDMHDADAGSAILALQQSGSFSTPRHLYAQKLDVNGALLWGAAHVAVFDNGSLQIGNFPRFVPDGSGGAVFGWYSSSPTLECRTQRVSSAGTELFPHNGVTAAIATADRVSPAVAFDPITQATYLVYTEQRGGGQDRIAAQRFDSTGTRQWGPSGSAVTNYGSAATANVTALAMGDGVMASWTEEPSFGQDRIFGARLDGNGAAVAPRFAVSSTPATKFRVDAGLSALGFAILAWRDEGSGDADILAQNVLPSGALGGVANAITRNGTGINPTCYTTSQRPAIGASWAAQVSHSPTASSTVILVDFATTTGPIVPGVGELLVPLPVAFFNLVSSTGVTDTHTLMIPADLALVGGLLASQAATIDGGRIRACNAIDLTVGL